VRTFMTSSGLNVPRPAIPIPDFAVPKAAPTAAGTNQNEVCHGDQCATHLSIPSAFEVKILTVNDKMRIQDTY
jgi:hypothetical protein